MTLRLKMLDKLEEQWKDCQRCELSKQRSRVVHWRGNPDAPLFIIGEAPGAEEDAQGRPFVGPAGRMLDRLLSLCGLGNDQVFIGNMVGCRPPGNRWPEREEVKACSPRLHVMLRIVRPRALLLLGAAAAKLAGVQSVSANRGQRTDVDILCYDNEIRSWPAMVTWHPSFVMRSGGPDWDRGKESLEDIKEAWKLADSVA